MVAADSKHITEALAGTERWFVHYGVPHFIVGPPVNTRIPRWLRPLRRAIYVALLSASVVTWAGRRVAREFREIGVLAGRGLPMVVLFGVLTFFSADFWHIAVAMGAQRLWVVAGLFLLLTVVFLRGRLPDELNRLDAHCTADQIRSACRGTPIAQLVEHQAEARRVPEPGRTARNNMLVYLLLCQQIQVALLSWMVFFFFVAFGAVAIRPEVIAQWLGYRPHYPARVLGVPWPGVSAELLQVSFLLAALTAFYFTIAAVIDGEYREAFFARTLGELRRALGVRCGYLIVREDFAAQDNQPVHREPTASTPETAVRSEPPLTQPPPVS